MQNQNYELEALRRREMMDRAENRRRANALRNMVEKEPKRSVVSPALAQVGRTLSTIGNTLQQRYGDLQDSTAGTAFQPETA